MKKITAILAFLFICVACLSACGNEEPVPETTKSNDLAIIGTWEESFFDSGFIFNSDGTGTDTFWDLTFTYTAYDGELTVIYDTDLYGASTYTYKIVGNELTVTRTDTEEADTFTYTKVTQEATTEAPSEVETDADGNPVEADADASGEVTPEN